MGVYRPARCNLSLLLRFLAGASARTSKPPAMSPAVQSRGGAPQAARKPIAPREAKLGGAGERVSSRAAKTPMVTHSKANSPRTDVRRQDPNFMTSLARGLAVIQAFSQRQRDLTVSQISMRTGFSRAAVRRCLYTLTKLDFAASDDGRYFRLTPRVLTLGHSYLSSTPLAVVAQPILDNASRILHESCSVATLDRREIVYIARANATRIMSIDLGVGSRLPAFCTSMGRIL